MTTTAHSGISGMVTNTQLRESLDQGYTLPASWYTDPAFFTREKERIFHRLATRRPDVQA